MPGAQCIKLLKLVRRKKSWELGPTSQSQYKESQRNNGLESSECIIITCSRNQLEVGQKLKKSNYQLRMTLKCQWIICNNLIRILIKPAIIAYIVSLFQRQLFLRLSLHMPYLRVPVPSLRNNGIASTMIFLNANRSIHNHMEKKSSRSKKNLMTMEKSITMSDQKKKYSKRMRQLSHLNKNSHRVGNTKKMMSFNMMTCPTLNHFFNEIKLLFRQLGRKIIIKVVQPK